MNHPFTFIKSTAWRYFVHWSLWMFTLDEMRMKIAFTPFTLDETSAMHIQSVKCKFALSYQLQIFMQWMNESQLPSISCIIGNLVCNHWVTVAKYQLYYWQLGLQSVSHSCQVSAVLLATWSALTSVQKHFLCADVQTVCTLEASHPASLLLFTLVQAVFPVAVIA